MNFFKFTIDTKLNEHSLVEKLQENTLRPSTRKDLDSRKDIMEGYYYQHSFTMRQSYVKGGSPISTNPFIVLQFQQQKAGTAIKGHVELAPMTYIHAIFILFVIGGAVKMVLSIEGPGQLAAVIITSVVLLLGVMFFFAVHRTAIRKEIRLAKENIQKAIRS